MNKPRHGHRQRGAAAVELGILLLPLTTLVFGITECGRAMYQYDTLCKSVRAAARYLSYRTPGDAAAISVAKCIAVYGNTGCVAPALVPGLTTAMVSVADSSNDASLSLQRMTADGGATFYGVTNLLRVTVSGYTFTSAASFVVPTFNLEPISITMVQG